MEISSKPALVLLAMFLLAPCFGLKAESTLLKRCFFIHVKDALKINRDRKDFYANLSGGKTKSLSNEHIVLEKLLLPLALTYDLQDKKYYSYFKSPMCNILIDMKETPKLQTTLEFPKGKFIKMPRDVFKKKRKNLRYILKKGSSLELISAAEDWMASKYLKNPSYYCLTRHYLESIIRTAVFLPVMESKAKEHKLKAPTKMLNRFLKRQIKGLKWGNRLDKKAQPFQEQGISIFCRDNPFIPKPIL